MCGVMLRNAYCNLIFREYSTCESVQMRSSAVQTFTFQLFIITAATKHIETLGSLRFAHGWTKSCSPHAREFCVQICAVNCWRYSRCSLLADPISFYDATKMDFCLLVVCECAFSFSISSQIKLREPICHLMIIYNVTWFEQTTVSTSHHYCVFWAT